MRALAVLLLVLALPARGQDDPKAYLRNMCREMTSWSARQLAGLKDPELEKFLCIAAKANLRSVQTKDDEAQKLCTSASRNVIGEFLRRWPHRSPDEVVGKC